MYVQKNYYNEKRSPTGAAGRPAGRPAVSPEAWPGAKGPMGPRLRLGPARADGPSPSGRRQAGRACGLIFLTN